MPAPVRRKNFVIVSFRSLADAAPEDVALFYQQTLDANPKSGKETGSLKPGVTTPVIYCLVRWK
jgi:hypothetical protein